MTIGKLFIALGFNVENADVLDKIETGLKEGAGTATKMTLAVGALDLALLAMIDTAARAAQALQNFVLSTGLSSDELQMWQHAAQVAGLDANDLTGAIKALQTTRTNFAMGEPEAIGAWALLGVDPRQDPFRVIQQLRTAVAGFKDVGIARNLLGRVGLETLLPLLRSTNTEFERWSRNFIINPAQVNQLTRLNQAWTNLKTSIIAAKNQLAVIFAPAAEVTIRLLQWMTEKLTDVVKWLQDSGPVAVFVRYALIGIAVALGLIAIGFAALAAALGLAAAAFAAFDLVAAPVIPILAAISAIILVAAGAIAALILLVDDMWNAFTGGKSVLGDLGDKIFGPFFQWLFDMWDKVIAKTKAAIDFMRHPLDNIFGADAAIPTTGAWGQSSMHTENNVNIRVDGSGDPKATGKATVDAFQSHLAKAAYQTPVRNY